MNTLLGNWLVPTEAWVLGFLFTSCSFHFSYPCITCHAHLCETRTRQRGLILTSCSPELLIPSRIGCKVASWAYVCLQYVQHRPIGTTFVWKSQYLHIDNLDHETRKRRRDPEVELGFLFNHAKPGSNTTKRRGCSKMARGKSFAILFFWFLCF